MFKGIPVRIRVVYCNLICILLSKPSIKDILRIQLLSHSDYEFLATELISERNSHEPIVLLLDHQFLAPNLFLSHELGTLKKSSRRLRAYIDLFPTLASNLFLMMNCILINASGTSAKIEIAEQKLNRIRLWNAVELSLSESPAITNKRYYDFIGIVIIHCL